MLKPITALLFATLVSGCAIDSVVSRTSHPQLFKVLQTGQVPPAKVQEVADCVHDGFGGTMSPFLVASYRMLRRADGYRIETLAGDTIVKVSADVMDSGVVELRESDGAAWINTSGEREAFEKCTAKHMVSKDK